MLTDPQGRFQQKTHLWVAAECGEEGQEHTAAPEVAGGRPAWPSPGLGAGSRLEVSCVRALRLVAVIYEPGFRQGDDRVSGGARGGFMWRS